MRKLFFSLLIAILASSCGNATTNKNSSTVTDTTTIMGSHYELDKQSLKLTDMKLTEQEWQKVKASYYKIEKGREDFLAQDESGEAEMDLSGIITPEDVSLGSMIYYYALKQQGYAFLSDNAYIERIKYIFGIDLNDKKLNSNLIRVHDDYVAILIPKEWDNYDRMATKEFYPNRRNIFLLKKTNLCVVEIPTVDIIKMEESVDKQNVVIYNNPFFFHWNNYVLNNNQGSLVWLLNSEYREEIINLFNHFGYDKDDKINKLVLDDKDIDMPSKFIGYGIDNKLRIYSGVLQTINSLSTETCSDYFQSASNFIDLISYNSETETEMLRKYPLLEKVKLGERRKIVAYIVNVLQPLYKKYNGSDGYGNFDQYNLGVVDCFWNAIFNDHELLKEIEHNNCYNLPNLTKLIQEMKQDERLINSKTGVLEPWIFNPEDYKSNEK